MSHPIRIPEGIVQCATCGEYRGRCRKGDLKHGYSAEDLAGIPARYAKVIAEGADLMRPPDEAMIEVSCLCDGIVCPKCKKGRMHRPISNYYDARHNDVWHFPWFYFYRGCDECAAKRHAEQAEAAVREKEEELEAQLEEEREEREWQERRLAVLAAPLPEWPWPRIERPLLKEGPAGERLVYGFANSEYPLFLDEEEAWNRAALQRVLRFARTWREVKARVHPDQYAFFVRWWRGEWLPSLYGHEQWALEQEGFTDLMDPPPPRRRRRQPKPEEPFELIAKGSWLGEEDLRCEMQDWFPGEARLVGSSTPAIGTSFDEPCLELDYGRLEEIVSRLERLGYTCRHDEALMRAATGWRGWPEEEREESDEDEEEEQEDWEE